MRWGVCLFPLMLVACVASEPRSQGVGFGTNAPAAAGFASASSGAASAYDDGKFRGRLQRSNQGGTEVASITDLQMSFADASFMAPADMAAAVAPGIARHTGCAVQGVSVNWSSTSGAKGFSALLNCP